MLYRLFYDNVDLGEVRYVDADFPSSFGTWTPAAVRGTSDLCGHLFDYIEYSTASMALLDATDAGPEWQEFAGLGEPKYADLIESRLWKLVGADGHAMRILIPLFRGDGEITWRCDVAP